MPEWVANRPKRGFVLPFEQWFGDEWHEMFGDVMHKSAIPLHGWYQKWCLSILDRWCAAIAVGG